MRRKRTLAWGHPVPSPSPRPPSQSAAWRNRTSQGFSRGLRPVWLEGGARGVQGTHLALAGVKGQRRGPGQLRRSSTRTLRATRKEGAWRGASLRVRRPRPAEPERGKPRKHIYVGNLKLTRFKVKTRGQTRGYIRGDKYLRFSCT